jgi:FkbM family methyltransferase
MYGFEIFKFPVQEFEPLPVFDLAVELLILKKPIIKFIQVGANDGVFVDPLRKYVLRGNFRGILVEPQSDIFQKLVSNYSDYKDKLIFKNIGISDEKEINLYKLKSNFLPNDIYKSSVASSNKNITANQLGMAFRDIERIAVPCLTLDELIIENSFQEFDILQIDTEGYDLKILRTIDLAKYTPLIIQFEHGHLSLRDCSLITEYLNSNNYQIYWGGHMSDSVAIKKDLLLL